jgi:branched-chain amino acid transport system substrate-binding protein
MIKYVICGFLLLFLVACSAPMETETHEPIEIAFISALSGEASGWGLPIKDGFDFYIDQINEQGGINDRMIKILYEDDKCTSADGVTVFTKILALDDIGFIAGSVCSSVALAVADWVTEYDAVYIATGATHPDVPASSEGTFRLFANDAYDAYLNAEHAKEHGIQTVGILYVGDQAGTVTLKDEFSANVEAFGSVIAEESIKTTTLNYKTEITKLIQNSPDAVYLGIVLEQTQDLLDELNLQNYEGFVYVYGPAMFETVHVGALQVYYAYPDDVQTTNFWSDYELKTGEEPNILVASGYDSAKLLVDGLKVCGDDSVCVKNYLHTLGEFETSRGMMNFNENGDVFGLPYSVRTI